MDNGWLLFLSAGVGDFIAYTPFKCYLKLNQAKNFYFSSNCGSWANQRQQDIAFARGDQADIAAAAHC